MSNEFALTDEKLDDLFVKEVGSVMQIVEKLPRNNMIMPTCTRWFKIFQRAMPEEKFARNCMLLLLHKQLNDKSKLSYPFTDARSCKRDLRTLHQMSLTLQQTMSSMDDDSCDSLCSKEFSSPLSTHSSVASFEDNTLEQIENANKLLSEQNAAMAGELQALLSEKENLLQHRQSFQEKVEALCDYNTMYGKEISYMKEIFECSAFTALKLFEEPSSAKHPQYFVTLFSVLCDDPQVRKQFEQLDAKLGHLIRAHVDYYLRLSMKDQISRMYDELHAEVSECYKERLKEQKATQIQELSLMAKRCLMLLRDLFLDSYKGKKHVKRAVLKFLQERHNELNEEM